MSAQLRIRSVCVATDGFEAATSVVRRTALIDDPKREAVVRKIVAEVRERGDEALLELGRKFDSPQLERIEVTRKEIEDAAETVDKKSRAAIEKASENIRIFHELQLRQSWVTQKKGASVGQMIRPLEKVGIYVPGGTAVYPSSVLMAAVPAQVAGVRERFICTPARKDGSVDPLVLLAAKTSCIYDIFKVGGAQAIGAMAFGTDTVPAVDKIVGPGNAYVNIAKKLLWGVVDMDMLAGPSEVCVVADETAHPAFVAADMLTQAEHDPDCAAYLITSSAELAQAVEHELKVQMERQPRRDILKKALERNGAIIITTSDWESVRLSNICAPEHLALMVAEPGYWLEQITNAGAVMIGDYTPQTLGDYYAGPSHTLPTSGTARFASPLNVDTFIKKTSVIRYTRKALKRASPTLERLATLEGFEAHAEAVRIRFEYEEDGNGNE